MVSAFGSETYQGIVEISPESLAASLRAADIHLPVRPGCDAWLLAAMVAILVQDDLVDRAFLDEHTVGLEDVLPHFADFDVEIVPFRDEAVLVGRRYMELAVQALHDTFGLDAA